MNERLSKIKTKIVCTIGPSTWSPEVMQKLIDAGMTVARINASFADAPEIERVTKMIRELSDSVCVMLDLKGHKIRISDIGEPRQLHPGDQLVLSTDPLSNEIVVSYENLHNDIKVGAPIYIDDGKVQLIVKAIEGKKITCEVQNESTLKRLKTVNTPGTYLSFDPLTAKDKVDLEAGVANNVDMVAGSFIRDLADVKAIQERIQGADIEIIAKIEDPLGVKNFDEILENVYGIMVARGDLGVELPFEQIPVLQKEFVKKCKEVGKPVIVATHMLESMITNPAATRAEVSDVANAIYDGADAIMTSAETSTGNYPVETVKVMAKVAGYIEPQVKQLTYRHITPEQIKTYNKKNDNDIADRAIAIAMATSEVSKDLPIKAIIVVSKGGFTSRIIARHNPLQPIYVFTSTQRWARKLAMTRGVYAHVINTLSEDRDEATKQVVAQAKEMGIVEVGDQVALVIGSQMFSGINASTLELQKIM